MPQDCLQMHQYDEAIVNFILVNLYYLVFPLINHLTILHLNHHLEFHHPLIHHHLTLHPNLLRFHMLFIPILHPRFHHLTNLLRRLAIHQHLIIPPIFQ